MTQERATPKIDSIHHFVTTSYFFLINSYSPWVTIDTDIYKNYMDIPPTFVQIFSLNNLLIFQLVSISLMRLYVRLLNFFTIVNK